VKNITVIGLDVSTSTIGLGVLDYKNGEIRLKYSEYFKPPHDGSIFQRLDTTKKWFLQKLDEFKPDEVAIEEYIQFMKGGSGAKTIIPLALFNRTIGLAYYEKTGKEPNMLNVLTIRHALKFDKTLPGKEMMPDIVSKHLGISFPYIKDSGKKRKKVKKQNDLTKEKATKLGVKIESFDIADGIAVGLAYLKILSRDGN
jgi:hypothetical protein